MAITLKSLPDDWYDLLIEVYETGGSDEEVMAKLGLTENAFHELTNEVPFLQAVEHGRLVRYAWFLTWGRKNLNANKANYQGWLMIMRNEFGWDSKQAPAITKDEFDMKNDEEITRLFKKYIEDGIIEKALQAATS